MTEGLRNQLIGAWKVVSYVEEPVDGSPSFRPLGEHPKGIIMYTPDGYMSAQLSKKTLTHCMFVSLFPDWTGQTQPRAVKIENDILHLGTVSPIKSAGKTVMSQLTWKRAESQ